MRSKIISLSTWLLAIILCVCTAGAVFLFTVGAKAETSVTDSSDWTDVPSGWEFTEDGIVGTSNSFLGNYLLTTNEDLVGDYSVSATFTGSASVINNEIHFGIVPWYLDAQNYVIIYGQWKPDKGNKLACVEVLYFKDGAQYGTEGNLGWNDHWLDMEYADTLYTLKPTNTITLTVTKEYDGNGMDKYTVSVAGTNDDSQSMNESLKADLYSVSVPHSAKQAKAGLYTNGDTFKISAFSTQSLSGAGEYKNVTGTTTTAKTSSAEGWTYAEGTYSVNATNGTAADNQAIAVNPDSAGNYQISYTANFSDGSNRSVSVMPYYASENDYARFVITETASGAQIKVEGKVGGAAFSEDCDDYSGALDWTNLSVKATKVGMNINLYLGGDAPVATYTTAFTDGAAVGFGAAGGNVAFSSVATAVVQYSPYDWYINGSYYMSDKDGSSITVEDGTVTMVVDPSEDTQYARFHTASGYYNRIVVSADFTVTENEAGAEYGFYAYYVSDTEYVQVLVKAEGITLSWADNGNVTTKTYTFDAPVTLTEAHSLSVEATDSQVKVMFDDTAVVFDGESAAEVSVPVLAGLETADIGMLAKKGSISAENYAVSGFVPYSEVKDESGWSLYGARLNTWTVSEDGKKLSNNVNGGTTFKSTSAIISDPLADPSKGYYVATAVQVTEQINGEFKYGFIPYYKDADNCVYVWLSQWAGASTRITITACLNGQVVGNEWREADALYSMTDINYLEVQVTPAGDINVYLNRQFAPVYTTNVAGLGEMGAASYGINSFNVAAVYDDITISSERIYTVEDNVIITANSVPETGTVGKTVNLGVITAKLENAGTSVTPVITVTDPDNQEVTLNGVRFTPEKEGEYTVTITATDGWGNTNTLVKKINVTADGGSGGSDGGSGNTDGDGSGTTDNGGNGGLTTGAIVGIVIGGVVVLAAIGFCVWFFGFKKRK